MKFNLVDINSILEHACDRLGEVRKGMGLRKYRKPTFNDILWYSWPQQWGNTSCGFEGYGGQAMTTAQTIAVKDQETGAFAIYHAGRFAYSVKNPSDEFHELMKEHYLPGASDKKVHLEKATKPLVPNS